MTIFDNFQQFWIFWQFWQFLKILDNFGQFWQLVRQSWRLDIWDTDYNSDNWKPEYHDNLCYMTIKSDTGQHLQFLQCFRYISISRTYPDESMGQSVRSHFQISTLLVSPSQMALFNLPFITFDIITIPDHPSLLDLEMHGLEEHGQRFHHLRQHFSRPA